MTSYEQSKITLPTTTVGVGCIQSVIQHHDDIMCGRGKSHAKNKGNIKFIAMVRSNLERYQSAPKPIDRSIVVASLLSELIESGARFIKKDGNTKKLFVMSDDQAHQKIGHSIRDMIARSKKQEPNKSKNKSRLAKKKQLQKIIRKKIICFEPICHRSSHFINHDITRAFSMKSSDLLASALAVQQFLLEDNKDEQQNDIHNKTTDIIQPPELARCCSEESVETYIPQRSRSIISLSFFDSIICSEDDKDVLHDLTGEIFCLDFLS